VLLAVRGQPAALLAMRQSASGWWFFDAHREIDDRLRVFLGRNRLFVDINRVVERTTSLRPESFKYVTEKRTFDKGELESLLLSAA
jgi:hypothetical protein